MLNFELYAKQYYQIAIKLLLRLALIHLWYDIIKGSTMSSCFLLATVQFSCKVARLCVTRMHNTSDSQMTKRVQVCLVNKRAVIFIRIITNFLPFLCSSFTIINFRMNLWPHLPCSIKLYSAIKINAILELYTIVYTIVCSIISQVVRLAFVTWSPLK